MFALSKYIFVIFCCIEYVFSHILMLHACLTSFMIHAYNMLSILHRACFQLTLCVDCLSCMEHALSLYWFVTLFTLCNYPTCSLCASIALVHFVHLSHLFTLCIYHNLYYILCLFYGLVPYSFLSWHMKRTPERFYLRMHETRLWAVFLLFSQFQRD